MHEAAFYTRHADAILPLPPGRASFDKRMIWPNRPETGPLLRSFGSGEKWELPRKAVGI